MSIDFSWIIYTARIVYETEPMPFWRGLQAYDVISVNFVRDLSRSVTEWEGGQFYPQNCVTSFMDVSLMRTYTLSRLRPISSDLHEKVIKQKFYNIT